MEAGEESSSLERPSDTAFRSNNNDSDTSGILAFIDKRNEGEFEIREDLKTPFIVSEHSHFEKANYAHVALMHMLHNYDGVLNVYDDMGVPSTVSAGTKYVNGSISLREISELEQLCCDGYYIRGFRSWDATVAAIGADLINFGTATQLLDTKVFPDVCVENVKGKSALTTEMMELGGELLTLIATATGKRIFVPRRFMSAIAEVINKGKVPIDCLMRTDALIGFPNEVAARSRDVATFNSGGNGITVSLVVFQRCLKLAGVTPENVRLVQRGGSVPLPLRELKEGEEESGILGHFGKTIDEESFKDSSLEKTLSGAISINADFSFDFSTENNVS